MRHRLVPLFLVGVAGCAAHVAPAPAVSSAPQAPPAGLADTTWPTYGNDPGGSRYSPLALIDRTNVAHLRVAWTYHTGEIVNGDPTKAGEAGLRVGFETTPLFLFDTLYLTTPLNRVIALDPETGAERWLYDPKIDRSPDEPLVSRGVAAWEDAGATGGACQRRLFFGTFDARLLALDAETGQPCSAFGKAGEVNLLDGLGPVDHALYQVTSPPAVAGDLVIVGSSIPDNHRLDGPSGMVRAFDARTGALRWSWDPIPRRPDDPARKTWANDSASRVGGANVWSVMSVDTARGLVFLPTTSPSVDFFGGARLGNNEYANSVVALRTATGERVWSFQVIHHDVWDYDIPAEPTLVTVRQHGVDVPAVAQVTKMGHLFLLDRESGKPLFPVEERPVPASHVPGEQLAPTQPFPTVPPPLAPQHLTADDAWGVTPADRAACQAKMKGLRAEGVFTPPSLEGSILFPGNIGGMNWSGASFDPTRGLLITSTNRLATIVKLFPRANLAAEAKTLSGAGAETGRNDGTPYGMRRELLVSPSFLPCNPPPWGVVTAVDVATGAVRWEVPIGTMPSAKGEPKAAEWGSINLGGSIVTGGGLVFIAGSVDGYFRALDVDSGKELWRAELPASGKATPMTYRRRGKQYVVIAAGGHVPLTKPGDAVVAFALP